MSDFDATVQNVGDSIGLEWIIMIDGKTLIKELSRK